MTTIETTSGPTAEALREWFLHDSWTIAQGLALLIDVDPARVDFVDSFYDGSPWVAGPRLTPDEHSRIAKLARLWQGKPEHTCLRRAAPSYFIEWAESKGLPPQWLAVAQAAGIVVPTQPAPTAERLTVERAAMSSIKWEGRRGQLAMQGIVPSVIEAIIRDEQLAMRCATQPAPVATEQTADRQDQRLKACEDAGLLMPASHMGRMPQGIGEVAKRLDMTRQALTQDVKAALKRREAARRNGVTE